MASVSAAGLTQGEVARRCGTTQPAVSRLANGGTSEPPHSVGVALEQLFRESCPGQPLPAEVSQTKRPVVPAVRTSVATNSVAAG